MLLTFQTTELIYILTVKLTKHELFGYIPFGNFQSLQCNVTLSYIKAKIITWYKLYVLAYDIHMTFIFLLFSLYWTARTIIYVRPCQVAIHKCLLVTITHVLLNKAEFRVNKIIFLVFVNKQGCINAFKNRNIWEAIFF